MVGLNGRIARLEETVQRGLRPGKAPLWAVRAVVLEGADPADLAVLEHERVVLEEIRRGLDSSS